MAGAGAGALFLLILLVLVALVEVEMAVQTQQTQPLLELPIQAVGAAVQQTHITEAMAVTVL
jgi:hypothetical protein